MSSQQPAIDAEGRIRQLAANQFGVVSRAQSVDAGLSVRMIQVRLDRMQWHRIHRGVYRLDAFPLSWEQSAMALSLWAGDDGSLSHRSAGRILGFPSMDVRIPELTSKKKLHPPNSLVRIHHTKHLSSSDTWQKGSFRITSPTRTLLDLAGVVSVEILEEALDFALQQKLTSVPQLKWMLRQGGRRRGAGTLRALIEERSPGSGRSESLLETKLYRLIRECGLPRPIRQHEVVHESRVVARLDFAYPDCRVAIEADGYTYHGGRAHWQRDINRQNALAELGWTVVRFTWRDVTLRANDTVERIRRVLGGQGRLI